jgi:hypothetical protein
MELVRLIKMCLNKTYIKARIGKYFSNIVPIRKILKAGDALSIAFQLFSRVRHHGDPGNAGMTETEWDTSAPGLCW